MYKLKILFIDIDGVLNPMGYLKYMYNLNQFYGNEIKTEDRFGQYFAPYCIEALHKIIRATDCKIVISSTWRKAGLQNMKEMWAYRNLLGEVYDITPMLNLIRGDEVDAWLEENTVDSFCIIDDDADFHSHHDKLFVQTNPNIGLTDELANMCIEILNK